MSILKKLKLTKVENEKLLNWFVCAATVKTIEEHNPFLKAFLNEVKHRPEIINDKTLRYADGMTSMCSLCSPLSLTERLV